MTTWKAALLPNEAKQIVAAAVAEAGGIAAAEGHSGIDRRVLQKIIQPGKPVSFSQVTAQKFQRWLPLERYLALRFCCNRDDVAALQSREAYRLHRELGEVSRLAAAGFPSVEALRTPRARERQEVYTKLREREDLRPLFSSFEASMQERGLRVSALGPMFMEPRAQLACERVLGPLLDAAATEGVEPTWEELARLKLRPKPTGTAKVDGDGKVKPWRKGGSKRPSRLYRFLDLGMNRELILLNSGPRESRFVQAADSRREKEIRQRALEMSLLGHS